MRYILLILFALSLVFPQHLFAHGLGSYPIFKINGKFVKYSPFEHYSPAPEKFTLPGDLASELYIVNKPIEFEIFPSLIGIPEAVASNLQFDWDFGDGGKANGLKNTHTYTKPGTYILIISMKYEGDEQINLPEQLERILIHVLPDKDYKLPAATIRIDGQPKNDASTQLAKVDFRIPQTLDASDSKDGSSRIVEYLWDFGDGESGEQKVVSHKFDDSQYYMPAILRVKDEKGFYGYALVGLENVKDPQAFDLASTQKPLQQIATWAWLIFAGLAIALSLFVLKRSKRSKKK